MKKFPLLQWLPAIAFLPAFCAGRADAGVNLPPENPPPLQFAAVEIQRAASNHAPAIDVRLEIGTNGVPQSYRILRERKTLRVIGGDAGGAMYGGLDVAEAIRLGTVADIKPDEHRPFVAERGIKFNSRWICARRVIRTVPTRRRRICRRCAQFLG